MPLVRITLRKGPASEVLHAASQAVHQALVATANVPADDLFHVIEEVEAHQIVAHPTYGGVEARSERLVIVQITLNAGRTVEVKKALYLAIAGGLSAALGIRTDDVLINLVEVTKENWSFGKGLATYA